MGKLQEVREVYDIELPKIKHPDIWNDTLKNISQYYKLDFVEGLLVHAQATNATTLATYDVWQKLGRRVNHFEHGTAVFKSRTDTKLKYLFDITQTSGNAIEPKWSFGENEKKKLLERYNRKYDTNHEKTSQIVNEIFGAALKNHADDIAAKIQEFNPKEDYEAFRKLVADNALAIVMYRCGAESVDFDFSHVSEVVPDGLLIACGDLAVEVARETLLEIERAIRRKDYETQRDRLGLHIRRENENIVANAPIEGAGRNEHRSAQSDRYAQRTLNAVSGHSEYVRSERADIRGDSRESRTNIPADNAELEKQRAISDGDSSRSGQSIDADNERLHRSAEGSSTNTQLPRASAVAAPAVNTETDKSELPTTDDGSSLFLLPETTVKISFSESASISAPCEMSFVAANTLLRELNAEFVKINPDGGYDKTDFEITAEIDGEPFTYRGRYDIGSDAEDLYSHILEDCEYGLKHDEPNSEDFETDKYIHDSLLPMLRNELDSAQKNATALDKEITESQEKINAIIDDMPFAAGDSEHNIQLSFFENETPVKQGLFIGTVNTIEALENEILRGSGFSGGKSRVWKYWNENKPSTEDFAKYLKKECGIGGHSGEGDIGFIAHNGKGISIEIKTENGTENANFSWKQVADFTAELCESGKYYDDSLSYRELSRMENDCKYFLKAENGSMKYLEGNSVETHIERMLSIYNGIPNNRKPEWITAEDIENYKREMLENSEKSETGLVTVSQYDDNEIGIYEELAEIAESERVTQWNEDEKVFERGTKGYDNLLIAYRKAVTELPKLLPKSDKLLNFQTMCEYGYEYGKMLPVSDSRALELFDNGTPIYLLHTDNSESLAETREEITEFDGLLGIELDDWKEVLNASETPLKQPLNKPQASTQLSFIDGAQLTDKQSKELAELTEKIATEYKHWNELYKNGSSDRFYADGIGLELTRNHIIYYKNQLLEKYPENLPEIYSRELPPEVSRDYSALQLGDEITYEGIRFKVTEITAGAGDVINIELQDLSHAYPIFRPVKLYDIKGRYENHTQHDIPKQENEKEDTAEKVDTSINSDSVINVVSTPTANITLEEKPPVKPVYKATNFQFIENNYATGAKAKFRDNIAAIRKLYELEKMKRPATPDEQLILSKYVGWGGISKAFDEKADDWSKEYQELKNILDDRAYTAAFKSTLTAYYTNPELIKPIYTMLERFGFNGGEVLDPAMGTGNFFSVLPKEIADNSTLTGVEIDDITGRISKQLYPLADVQIKGFERTVFEDESFDVAVGNVPFGDFSLYDRNYKEDFRIHDYFFVKTLDKVKAGGIVAFITSAGTLDKMDNAARIEIANRAELLGAVRLPTSAFKTIAGTEVVSDLLVLKKLDEPRTFNHYSRDLPKWAMQPRAYYDTNNKYVATINGYFAEHPEMILGKLQYESGPYGQRLTCDAPENQDLAKDLSEALAKIDGTFTAAPTIRTAEDVENIDDEDERISAPEDARNYCYYLKDNSIFYCENGYLSNVTPRSATAGERLKGMCRLSELTQDVIDIQLRSFTDNELVAAQKKLSESYDSFVKKFGCLNENVNAALYRDDLRAPLLLSLEVEKETEEQKTVYEKADIFTKATIVKPQEITHADTAEQALVASLNLRNKVDIPYIAKLCGKTEEQAISELGNKIYLNPINYTGSNENGWELAEEYLSGYVKDKLETAKAFAKEQPELWQRNVDALENNQPEFVPISGIEFSIGTIYIPIDMYRQFMYDTFDTALWARHNENARFNNSSTIDVEYSNVLNSWHVTNKNSERTSVKVNEVYGTKRISAYEIMEQSLNLKKVEIKDRVEERGADKVVVKYVLNKNETLLARERQSKIEAAFKSWVLSDTERIERIESIYNDKYNVIKPRSYDGSYVTVPGLNPNITLRKHQLDVIARIVHGGCTMMAHEVGAGKTAAMAAASMYMRSLGIAHKPIFAVPKPIVSQWGREFMRFFPSAKILVATTEDFEKKNRRRFLGKIATGDFDAVIIGQTQLEKLPLSLERQEAAYEDKIARLSLAIQELKKEKDKGFGVKQMAGTRVSIEKKLEKLRADFKKDDFITLEELGGDFLFVDEAHNYKNLALFTKMNNVSGINSNSDSQRASDMEMKVRYMQEINGGGGVVFATGTPVSNTLSELYVMQHYLQPDTLRRMGLEYFDNWASVFGKTVTALEVMPSGNGFKMKTRFAEFHNLPELANTFMQAFDIKKTSEMGLKLPKIEGGKPEIVVCEKSAAQEEQVEIGMARAQAIEEKKVDRTEDNMLSVCTYMTKVALDGRIIEPDAEDYDGSKVNTCVRNILEIDAAHPNTAQVVFCDTNVPQSDGKFSVYSALKDRLVESRKYTADEIAFIHDATTDAQRDDMFKKVNSAKIRVIVGSTGKLGTGVNIQQKLVAAHHLDAPYRPADLEQRNGRIVRQGNENESVRVIYYSTKGTFDTYRWQLLEKKQYFISQIMSGKPVSRSCEDVDDATLTFSEMKAATTENPLIAEKLTVDNEVNRLTLLRNEYLDHQRTLKKDVETNYPDRIEKLKRTIEACNKDIATVNANSVPDEGVRITIGGKLYTEREAAGEQLVARLNKYMASEECKNCEPSEVIGSYRGMELMFTSARSAKGEIICRGAKRYYNEASFSALGMATKVVNFGTTPQSDLRFYTQQLSDAEKQLEAAKAEYGKTWEHEKEMQEALEKQAHINNSLAFSEQQDEICNDEEEAEI